MKRYIIIFSLIFLIAGIKTSFAQANPEVAVTVPDFTFFTLDGNKRFTQGQLPVKGRIVFVFFDPDCSHCQDELTDIGNNLTEFKNASFFLVAMQDKPIIYNFMAKYGTKLQGRKNVTVLHDANYEFIGKFQPNQYPALYVYGADRKLIHFLDGQKKIKEIILAVNK